MGTYLYHYSRNGHPLLGLFVTPASGELAANVETMSRHSQHKLGVVTFNIDSWDDEPSIEHNLIEKIRTSEKAFVEKVAQALKV